MDQRGDSSPVDEAGRSSNHNKPLTLADIEFQTSDDQSQDLFNDNESSLQDSPSINFDVSEIVGEINSPQTTDLLTSLTATPKIEAEDSRLNRPTVPTIPTSLVPFISTVNESWTSDLETPQAKISDSTNLRRYDINGQLSESCENIERKGCDSMRMNRIIPDVTTPSGCFVAIMEDEALCTSPILNLMTKRRRPKRRILKSLIDTSISTDCSTDLVNIRHASADDYAAKEIESLGSGATNDNLRLSNASPVDNTTFVIDDNYSLHNSNIHPVQDEMNDGDVKPRTEITTDKEECLMNQRLQSFDEDFGETISNDTLKNEERRGRSSESADEVTTDSIDVESRPNKADGKSLAERVREIKKLEEKEDEVAEYKFADIPIDVFTRDAKALENAELIPRIPPNKSNVKKQWGLISFTEMCLLEQENSKNGDSGIKETNDMDTTIKNSEFSCAIQEDKVTAQSTAFTSDDDIVDIFASSFHEQNEPVIDIDEFSPWLYQSNEIKSEFPSDLNNDGRKTESVTTVIPVDKEKEMAVRTNESIDCQLSLGKAKETFITANEDKIKINQRNTKDGEPYQQKIFPKATAINNFQVGNQESYGSIGFSTASGKPITISEDKLKAATKLYDEIAVQDGMHCDVKMRDEIRGNERRNNKENETTNFENSRSSMGFSTAGGKPINISEDKLKAAAKLYEEVNSSDNLQIPFHSPKVPMARGIKRRHESYNVDSDKKCGVDSSIGFTTAGGKPLIVSETAMKKAKMMYESENILESQLPQGNDSTKQCRNSKDLLKSKPSIKNYDHRPIMGLVTSNVRHPERKESSTTKAAHILNDENIFKLEKFPGGTFNKTNSISDNKQSGQLKSSKNLFAVTLQASENEVDKVLPGFCTASGKGIKISDQALANAKILLAEEDDCYKSSPLSHVASSRGATGRTELTRKSGDALVRSKKLFTTEQENTPPHNSALKRSSAAMETFMNSNVSVSKTSAVSSVSEKISSDDFQSSKKVRFNTDLQARKLFSEKNDDTDEETECPDKFYTENNRGLRTPLNSSSNYAHYLLSHSRKENVSFIENNTAGMYAKSEMFEINDRLMNPKLKPQKTWPSNQDIDDVRFPGKSNNENSLEISQVQKDRRIPTFFDEITASTEALLADEDNSFDGRSWGSAITCSPTLIQDREISVKPITLHTECGDVVQEVPTSPIIGSKFRSRKKHKRNKRNLVKKDAMNLNTIRDNDCNINGDLDEQINTQNSRQSSGVDTPTSSSSKGTTSSVIETALVSELERLEESSRKVQVFDNRPENPIRLSPNEAEDREAIDNLLENRIAATLEQDKRIRAKKKCRPKPIPGSLLLRRLENRELRVSWREATNGAAPTPRISRELVNRGVSLDVMEVTAATALDYKFKCSDFYSKDKIRSNPHGLEMGDGSQLIVDENGYAGVVEFERAFMASPGVDPTLVPERWVGNHYRWIVWKLASMDRMKFGDLSLPMMLTPHNVMEQLKYRYDREIDKSQRPALRRIIEKDDPPNRRIVLCVATITKLENMAVEKSPGMTATSHWKVELTDGWYSVMGTIDSAMVNLIAFGKVREGTKLVTSRAELLNSDQGCSPLEIPSDLSLKIHTNSTRRSKWDTKLGYCKYASPIPTLLSAVLPNGGLIGKLNTTIARVYPIQYFERTWSGQSVFRNNKCEDKAAMMYEKERQRQIDAIYAQTRAKFEARNRRDSKNLSSALCGKSSLETDPKLYRNQWNDGDPDSYQACFSDKKRQSFLSFRETEEAFQSELESVLRNSLPPPRKVTLVLKVRVMEGENLAILTVWAPSEDIVDVLKEGNRVSIHNVQTSGKRSGELQLTAGHQSFVKPAGSNVSSFPRRCLTSIPEVAVPGFNPPFGEFDTVGMVVSLGPAPHGMKNFEIVNLAYPHPDSSSSTYLSILFWEGIATHGFSDILTVGSIVACTNLQWRRGAPRTIPMAYSTEHSTFTRNPRQAYLRSAFDAVKDQIKDPLSYASQCTAEIAIEHQKKPTVLRSPAVQGTPSKASPSAAIPQDKFTPGVSPRTPQGTINSEKNTPAKYSIQRRLEKLQWYGEPPELSPVTLNHISTKVKQKFVPPARTPEH